MTRNPPAPRPGRQWGRHLLGIACAVAALLLFELSGLKDWLYGIRGVLPALRLLVILICLAIAFLLLFVRDEELERHRLRARIYAAFALAMAAAQAALLIADARHPSDLF
ncbi:MAG TPA: hypothetical protein VF727_00345 [Allosphingosinicella sp.]|jgi:hypothetical protein